MLVYLRKITNSDTKKQVETTAEAYEVFFGGNPSVAAGVNVTIEEIYNGSSETFTVSKAAGNANSYRFSSATGGVSFGKFIENNAPMGLSADDILKIEKKNGKYSLEMITPADSSYTTLDSMIVSKQNTVVLISGNSIDYKTGCNSGGNARNIITFGAPGTGKSHLLEEKKNKLIGAKNHTDFERVTFYENYSYAQFVGTYKPVMDGTDIKYKFVPGPFIRVLVKALRNCMELTSTSSVSTATAKPYVLIVEEINRGNAASIFGDIFQLLDRDGNGVSEYPISTSKDLRDYLAEELNCSPELFEQIQIPDNMFIWATMNSADQGVFPLDSAFKRRWDFDYLSIDKNETDLLGNTNVPGVFKIGTTEIEWNALRKSINDLLSSDNVRVHEDKLLGPFFINTKNLMKNGSTTELIDTFSELVESKVLMYIFEDAAKTRRTNVFKANVNTSRFSELCKAFQKDKLLIFDKVGNEDFVTVYNKYASKPYAP